MYELVWPLAGLYLVCCLFASIAVAEWVENKPMLGRHVFVTVFWPVGLAVFVWRLAVNAAVEAAKAVRRGW